MAAVYARMGGLERACPGHVTAGTPKGAAMKNLLVAAALAALFAATPALAQRDRGGDRPDRGQAGQAQTQAPPTGGNGGRDRGGFDRQNRGFDRGFNRDTARAPQTAPTNPGG